MVWDKGRKSPFLRLSRNAVVDFVRRRADTRDVVRRREKRSGSFPVQVTRLAAASETAYPTTKKIITHLDKRDGSEQASWLPPCRVPPQAGLFD